MSVLDDPTFLDNEQWVVPDDSRILGGADDEGNQFPDCVAVGTSNRWCCSGVLVGAATVLTAAHCVRDGCAARVFVGADVGDPGSGAGFEVAAAVAHPAWKRDRLFDDIGVLRLAHPVDGVLPRRIAAVAALDSAISVRLAGFGTTTSDGRVGFGRRRLVDVPLAGADPRYGAHTSTEFVAGRALLERDSCPGDSGGPAYVEEGSGGWSLAGLTSRATPGGYRFRRCGDGGIYTRVTAYADWLAEVGS
jgi:secreted trypsin-like serine protease